MGKCGTSWRDLSRWPAPDWVITDPPFRLAEPFIQRALLTTRVGVAVFARTVFTESVGRHSRLFAPRPPSIAAQFSERVPIVKGRLDPEASSATSYSWFVWLREQVGEPTRLVWIPPCRKELEREGDYEKPSKEKVA
jgi:hypothetical protein